MTTPDSLIHHLANALPAGLTARLLHVSTTPFKCPALFAAPPDQEEESTSCQNHFIAFAGPGSDPNDPEVLVYAIEIFLYSTKAATTVFVSKADTSGHLNLLNVPAGAPSFVRTVTTSILEYLVSRLSPHAPVVLSLFARAQNQYLFPGSVETPGKHLLDDRQLIKWWCRIFDDVIRSPKPAVESTSNTRAYLVVPGCDRAESLAFLPSTARKCPPTSRQWANLYPVDSLAPILSAPVRCLIPRFPDDPKERFVEELDFRETQKSTGDWRSIRSLDQFWEMMQYRQECSAGKLVGFLWAIFEKSGVAHSEVNGIPGDVREAERAPNEANILPTPTHSQQAGAESSAAHPPVTSEEGLQPIPPQPSTPPPSSPVIPLADVESTQHPTLNPYVDPLSTKIQPSLAISSLVLTKHAYDLLMTELLSETDFSTLSLAKTSTAKWIDRALDLSRSPPLPDSDLAPTNPAAASSPTEPPDPNPNPTKQWGHTITGRRHYAPPPLRFDSAKTAPNDPPINVLTAVRKKRKVADALSLAPSSSAAPPPKRPEQ